MISSGRDVPRSEVPPFVLPHGQQDPYPAIAAWRRRHPVCLTDNEELGWIVTGADAVDQLMRSDKVSVGDNQIHLDRPSAFSAAAWRRWLTSLDPPDHTAVRREYQQPFNPRPLEALEGRIGAICDRLLDAIDTSRPFDFIERFAYHYPVDVICEWLAVPEADRETLRLDAATMAPLLGPAECAPERVQAGSDASDRILRYFQQLIAARRASPGKDLLSMLVTTTDLDETTMIANAQQMFFAGHETTTGLLGSSMLAMLQNPAQMQMLRDDPRLIPDAIEEFLRWQPPVFLSGRTATADLVIQGVPIPKGARLIMAHGGSNRDPARFADPDRVDILRFHGEKPPTQLGFGVGRHHCLGSHLARLETKIALTKVLGRWSRIELEPQELKWLPMPVFRRLSSLVIRVS